MVKKLKASVSLYSKVFQIKMLLSDDFLKVKPRLFWVVNSAMGWHISNYKEGFFYRNELFWYLLGTPALTSESLVHNILFEAFLNANQVQALDQVPTAI